jgi:hypothetical protein
MQHPARIGASRSARMAVFSLESDKTAAPSRSREFLLIAMPQRPLQCRTLSRDEAGK